MKTANSSNTKAEILESYQELLAKLENEKAQNSKLKKEKEDGQQLVETVKSHVGQQGQNLAQLRAHLLEQLDAFDNKLSAEKNQFENLCAAIENCKKELALLHQIKGQAESLEALIILQKQKKAEFEAEMEQQIKAWDRDKEAIEYKAKIQQRNDEDAYRQQKAKQEKELKEQKAAFELMVAEKEADFASKVAEYHELKSKASTFDEQLLKIALTTEQQVTEKLTREMDFNRQLANKDFESDIKLLKLEIESLKTRVKEQAEDIVRLTSKSDHATAQVKEIALKAIENKGKMFAPESRGE